MTYRNMLMRAAIGGMTAALLGAPALAQYLGAPGRVDMPDATPVPPPMMAPAPTASPGPFSLGPSSNAAPERETPPADAEAAPAPRAQRGAPPMPPGVTSVIARFTNYQGFERLSFRSASGQDPQIRQVEGGVEVVFAGLLPIRNEDEMLRGLRRYAGGVTVTRDENATRVRLVNSEGTTLRSNRSLEGFVWVDLRRDRNAPPPRPVETAAAPAAVPPPPPAAAQPEAAAPAPAAPAPAAPPAAPPQQAVASPPAPAPVEAAPPLPPAQAAAPVVPAPVIEPAPAPAVAAPAAAPAPLAEAPAAPPPAAPIELRVQAPPATPVQEAATPVVPPVAAITMPANPPRVQATPAPAPSAAAPRVAAVEITRTADGVALRFAWSEPVAAAVFMRGSALWIAFDTTRPLDVTALTDSRDPELGQTELSVAGATVVRMAGTGFVAASARREDHAWVVELLRRARPPATSLPVELRNGEGGLRLWVPLPGAQRVIRLDDPETGDPLFAIPSAAGGHAVEMARSFPQFRLFATAQGVVVDPRADGLDLRTLGGGVAVGASGGLVAALAPDLATERADRRSTLFDFEAWQRGGPRRFVDERAALQRAVGEAREEERGTARLALAQFLFAHGFAGDALAVLRLIEQEQPAVLRSPRALALRGVAALVTADLELAGRALRDRSLADHPEAALWRAMLLLEEGDGRAAVTALARARDISLGYPPPYANRLGLAVAEIRIAAENVLAAEERLAQVLASQPTPGERAQAEFLRGRILAATRPADAERVWIQLEQGPPTPARVRATLARIELQRAAGTLDIRAAAETLDRLRYAWRGDELEFRVVTTLAGLLNDAGETRRALATWREALALMPSHADVPALRARMSDAFAAYVLDGAFDAAPAVSALGLYEEARDLTPQDERRAQIASRVADRLVRLDLLDRAAALLETQLRGLQSGEERAQLGARLTVVRLFDRKPQQALDALARSAGPGISAETLADRRRLEARARADLGRAEDALALIADDRSADGERLRAELQLRARDWAGLAVTLARMVGTPETLDEDQARSVLHLTVASVLSGDAEGLAGVRTRFAAAMADTPFKDLFAILTATRDAPPADMRAVAQRVASSAPFQSFLAQYRARLGRPGA